MLALEPLVLGRVEEPFPGLRAFEASEALIFFGRRAHTEALLRRLGDRRFLAVVGSSGCGKSSLVRAGLLPALYRGELVSASSRWRIALLRPGEAPFTKLAEALVAEGVLPSRDPGELREKLSRTSLSLVRAIGDAGLPPRDNLLIVVDQFEELFRFASSGRERERHEAEAALFVASLLEAVEQGIVPVYVVLTMRSDFLGDCARFPGLPEALNDSQYLVPRLTRRERQEAIEGPLRVASVGIAPALVQRLLNDAGDEPDQLPVLQHALMRTFRHWRERVGGDREEPVGHSDYEAAGGMDEALDRHAMELYRSLPDDAHRHCAERIFRCLTTVEKGRAVRRPAALARIYEVTGATAPGEELVVRAVIERFAARESSFLLSSTGGLARESMIDISHESLVARWTLLGAWLLKEVKASDCYRYAARDALLHPNVSLWRDPELADAERLVKDKEWSEAWARQYESAGQAGYEDVIRFLEESRRAQDAENEAEKRRRRQEIEDARKLAAAEARGKRWFRGFTVLLAMLLATAVGAWMYVARVRSERVELLSQLSELDRQKYAAEQRLADLEARGGASEVELQRLRSELEELNRKSRNAEANLRQTAPASTGPEALIGSLRDQLSEARLELANARPRAVSLPENSLVRLDPRKGEPAVAFLMGEAGESSASLYVLVAGPKAGVEPFRDNARMASGLIERIGMPSCPAFLDRGGADVWCFPVERQRVGGETQELGRFSVGGVELTVVAMGWADRYGTDVITLSVFPAPEDTLKTAR